MCPALRHTSSRLKWDAVPSIWCHKNPPADSKVKARKPPIQRFPLAKKQKQLQVLTSDCEVAVNTSTKIKRQDSAASKIQALRQKVWKLEKSLKRSQAKIKVLKAQKVKSEALVKQLLKKTSITDLGKRQQVFVHLQLRAAKKKKIARYTSAELQEALALYHRGPAAYRHMQSIHKLPSMTTIRRQLSKCMKKCGPCPVLKNAIKARLDSCENLQRIATLCFDGMKITPALRYWEHEDRYKEFY